MIFGLILLSTGITCFFLGWFSHDQWGRLYVRGPVFDLALMVLEERVRIDDIDPEIRFDVERCLLVWKAYDVRKD